MAEQLDNKAPFKDLAKDYWEKNSFGAGTTGRVYRNRMARRDQTLEIIASKAVDILKDRDEIGGRRFLKRLEGIMGYETRLDKGHPFKEDLLREIIIKLSNTQE